MKKTTVSSNSFGGFLSPGAPNYSDNKGWSSERIPHPPTITNRRHIGSSSSALTTPFYSGRSIPSKWEDAERWICSPNPPGVCQNASTTQKSKSGPIVPPPTLPHPQGSMKVFSTGVLDADRVFRGSVGGGSVGIAHGHSRSWIDLMSEENSSLSSEEKEEEEEEMTTAAQSPVVSVSRRDMATQMSSEGEKSPPPLVVSVVEATAREEATSSRGSEVREVKMDKGAKMIKRPKRRVVMSTRVVRREEQPEVEENSDSSSWDVSEPAMNLSKLQREEAKIAAWENLQKAKAEGAIRKLEVKLEKKKSASMDKIVKKLQTAKLKAQEMRRSSVSVTSDHDQEQQQISRSSVKITHIVRRHTFMSPFMTCFAPRVDCRKSSSAT